MVVSAIGMLNEFTWPDIDGLDSFKGKRIHSARWDWDHDLTGLKIGVVGSAASAVQLVPEIVKKAGQVHLFQRTANWVLPKLDTPYTEEELENFLTDPNLALTVREETFNQVDGGMTFSDPAALAEMETYGMGAIEQVEAPRRGPAGHLGHLRT